MGPQVTAEFTTSLTELHAASDLASARAVGTLATEQPLVTLSTELAQMRLISNESWQRGKVSSSVWPPCWVRCPRGSWCWTGKGE